MENMSKMLESIEEMTTNVDAVQERVLSEILARNGDAEYLAKCGLAGGAAAGRATFRAKVPVVTYEDLKPYILRVANGDTSPVLTGPGHPVSELIVTTGTSGGEPKLIPAVEDEIDRRMLQMSFVTAVMNQHVPGLDKGAGFYFNFVKCGTTTPGGLPARTLTTSLLQSDQFKRRRVAAYDPSNGGGGLTSPAAAVLCEDAAQSMYAQMLCGLRHRHAVLRIGAAFAYGLVRAVSFLQRNWAHLADDIEAGVLAGAHPRVTDPSVRAAVNAVLRRPDPDLARFIRTECGGTGECWAGILTRLWPNIKYLDAISTGTMAQYVPTLRYFTGGGGDLPIVSTVYMSSECSFGVNLRPMSSGDGDPADTTYTIMPNMAYFEFLPTDKDNAAATDADTEAEELVELAGVEAGREYELVVTTYSGLCRYRMGDVVRVSGFHNAAPELRFVRRRGVALSVDVERTDEADLHRAVARASAALLAPRGAAVADYTARTCTDTVPGHYVVYWELDLRVLPPPPPSSATAGAVVDGDVLGRCCLEMEEALSYSYREKRVGTGSIGPLEIRVVRPGTFEELADDAVVSRGGASVAQYKVPRCVKAAPAIVELLDSRVVSRHLSPALPHWDPAGLRFEQEETATPPV